MCLHFTAYDHWFPVHSSPVAPWELCWCSAHKLNIHILSFIYFIIFAFSMQQQLEQQALSHFVHLDVASPARVPVMHHKCWLMYRWISGMVGGEQGPCPVCWKDEEICHYPVWTIPLTLPGTLLLIALRIHPETVRRNTTDRHGESINFHEDHQAFFHHNTNAKAWLSLVAIYKTAFTIWQPISMFVYCFE